MSMGFDRKQATLAVLTVALPSIRRRWFAPRPARLVPDGRRSVTFQGV
jgi:hypothetical protein